MEAVDFDFCPNNTAELYEKLAAAPGLRGKLTYNEDETIVWDLSEKLILYINIDEGSHRVNVWVNTSSAAWRPAPGKIYEDLLSINRGGWLFAVEHSILGDNFLYVGTKMDFEKKSRFGLNMRRIEYIEE